MATHPATYAALLSDLAITYRHHGLQRQAIDCFQQAEALDPDDPLWRLHSANARLEHGDLQGGLRRLEELLADDPGNPQAHWQLAYALLLRGCHREAWPHFAWRWRCPSFPSRRLPTIQAPWDGQSPCRRLLIWGEQGICDEVLFAGLLPEARDWLAGLGASMVALAEPRLVAPLRRALPDLEVHPWGAIASGLDWDQHLPAADLCRWLRPEASSFPSTRAPWLRADPWRVAALRASLPPADKLRIGLSWRSKAATLGRRKSLPLAPLVRALTLPGVQLLSLQYGSVTEELTALREATGLEVLTIPGVDLHDDLDDLAALISCCDLVISVSNATAHLSGAMGKPTWLALHQVPYWPWGLEGECSPWYPSLRLFRQGSAGCWREPLGELRGALAQRLGAGEKEAEQPDTKAPTSANWQNMH
ncbi:MAG: tetratricopeptide repeat protein [Cyanobacteriota bacterium]